jgi:hypothetical protein
MNRLPGNLRHSSENCRDKISVEVYSDLAVYMRLLHRLKISWVLHCSSGNLVARHHRDGTVGIE